MLGGGDIQLLVDGGGELGGLLGGGGEDLGLGLGDLGVVGGNLGHLIGDGCIVIGGGGAHLLGEGLGLGRELLLVGGLEDVLVGGDLGEALGNFLDLAGQVLLAPGVGGIDLVLDVILRSFRALPALEAGDDIGFLGGGEDLLGSGGVGWGGEGLMG